MTVDLTSHRNLGDAFFSQVAIDPERIALTVYGGSTAESHEHLTFGALAERVRVRAAGLAARLEPGERVLIALPTGLAFVETYLACLVAGLVAVPAPAAGGSMVAVERLASIAMDCSPGLVATTESDREAVAAQFLRQGLDPAPVVSAEAVGTEGIPPLAAVRPAPGPDALAIIQYSSGSTGTPRGVMLAHADVQANVKAVHEFSTLGGQDTLGSWLPLHHDFGLFMQLTTAMMYGSSMVLMPPTDFLRRPVEWLRMLSALRCTATSAVNFSLDLCLRLITDEQMAGVDLSSVRWLGNGSEPIHAATMTAFSKRFAAWGLRPEAMAPGYGMAECTVFVSCSPVTAEPTVLVADAAALETTVRPELRRTVGSGRELVGLGATSAFDRRIVDADSGRVLPEGCVGEVWLRGPGVGRGYWNQPEQTAQVFRGRITESADPADLDLDWLRTGDLGALVDGELYITGRIKEVIIVRGRKLFPHDLEQQARAAHPALVGFNGAAFGVVAHDERVVLIHEVSPGTAAEDLPAIAKAVVQRLSSVFGVPVRNIVLVRRGTVRRTTSGKIQRAAMRERFLAAAVPALYAEVETDLPKPASAVDVR